MNTSAVQKMAKTYIAQFIKVAKQIVRFSEHKVALNLHFLQRLHETLHIYRVAQNKTSVEKKRR